MSVISDYLKDPFLNQLYQSIRNAGPIKSVSLDITHKCNLRCTGCYYFQEGMDVRVRPGDDRDLLNWVLNEKKRGTNFVTIVGGEPSLEIDRLRLLYRHFKLNVATNGLVRIPEEGLEDMPIGVAIWGNTKSDSQLRANGKRDLFSRALKNYKNDSRAFWYYTVAPGLAHEVYEVVERCIENGNRILFNYYSDLARKGTGYDFADGANALHEVIEDVMEKYPNKVLSMPYLHEVIMTGSLKGQQWGYDVCTNLSTDFKGNSHRLENGNPYNRHFRAYNADFTTSRRCCTGVERDCTTCMDTWEHYSWIMIQLKKHLSSKEDFANWLVVMYSFYLINRLVPDVISDTLLRTLHRYSNTAKLV